MFFRVLPNLITRINFTTLNLLNSLTNFKIMTNIHTPDQSQEELMELMMFASHTMNIWYSLYHYMKMGGTFSDLPFLKWVFDGVPKEYLAPPQEIEVMNNPYEFHDFRQKMITHLYQQYVVEWDSDSDS